MRPLKLTMQAFGSYGKQTSIDFTEPDQNLFLITGNTGAGKSTIFDAIVFALYGEASSGNNKKNGAELQSQYAGLEISPFVELTFSEKNGDVVNIYTARRVPRHIRPLRKGTGVKDEKETVSLIMPDNTEYSRNQKETDGKLEEIVGLTKDQFMQVAMIAQGEFMEMLRAKSDDKKIILRKLFNTGLFQNILDELGNRRKEKLGVIEQLRISCQAETSHIVIPEDHEKAGELREVMNRILSAEHLSITDMEYLMEELKKICTGLSFKRDAAREKYTQLSTVRDARRDTYTRALPLLKSFEQLEGAKAELAACEADAENIRETKRQLQAINDTYDIKAVWQRYTDAENAAADTKQKQKEQQEALPGLASTYEKTAVKAEAAKQKQNAELEAYTRMAERVKKSLVILKKIHENETETDDKAEASRQADEAALESKNHLLDFIRQKQEWKQQADGLKDADTCFKLWEKKSEEAKALKDDIDSAKNVEKEISLQKRKAEDAGREYREAKQRYIIKNSEFFEKQNAFLDAQAGVLAKEKLKEGQPCPVCGSTVHPKPCRISKEHKDLTREIINELSAKVEALQQAQSEKAMASGSAADLLKEKESNLAAMLEKLRMRIEKTIPDASPLLSLEDAGRMLHRWTLDIQQEGELLKERVETLAELQAFLENADEQESKLREESEDGAAKASEAKIALASCKTVLKELEAQKDHETEEEANSALCAAEAQKKEADAACVSAEKAAQAARTAREEAETLIRQYGEALPLQQTECELRKTAYEEIMKEKGLTEPEWRSVAEQYEKSDTERLKDTIDTYGKRKASAVSARDTAEKVIGDQQKPVIEELQEASRKAEEQLISASEEYELLKEQYKADHSVYSSLEPMMEERIKVTTEQSRLDSLYNRLAGKVTGARMDIETFVQRYYMQRILYAANDRFRDMSAGQFELRMVGEEDAGEGKNRGLDLMVYSTVTGKEREVRTLSGGESFMAALSLALGMADQIKESVSAINLDVMFIDEGFGSLDDHLRNQAVRVLQQMAGSTKLIGIISHVPELKQEIEDQLIVTKDEEGSHVKWQIS